MSRVWIRLLVVAVLAMVAVLLMRRGAPEREAGHDLPALPGLETRINTLDRVRVSSAAGTVTLARVDGEWRVDERAGWPADKGKLRDWLLRLSTARRIEAKTRVADNYARLGVEDIGPDAGGARVELEGGGEPLALIVGQNNPQGQGSYVRVPGEAQSWLTDLDLAPERKVTGWLARDLLDLDPRRLLHIELTPNKSEHVRLDRGSVGDGSWQLQGLRRAEQTNPSSIDAVAGFLQGLRLDDVEKAGEIPADAASARFVTTDGLQIEMRLWSVGAQPWARFSVSFDAQTAQRSATDAFAKEQAALDAQRSDADTNDRDSDEAAELGVESVAARVERVRAEAARIAARVDGWQFALTSYKADNLRKPRSAYVTRK